MNVSYDNLGADAGWGDEGETVSQANIPDPRRSFAGLSAVLEKIAFPVTFKSLCQLPPNAEKYIINNYTFANLRTFARIISADYGKRGEYVYECCDESENANNANQTIPFTRYTGVDASNQKFLEPGTLIEALGKLRPFGDKFAFFSHCIREINDPQENAFFELEAKLAHSYYAKNLPLISKEELIEKNIGIFSPLAPEPKSDLSFRKSYEPQSRLSNAGYQTAKLVTPNNASTRQTFQFSSDTKSRLNEQQKKILDCIKTCGQNSDGISITDIKAKCRLNTNDYDTHLNYLLDQSLIYSTVDDHHFSAV
ncbi:Replication Protein A like protein [Ditylenchus destructor]|nr:Replication Protein A like protein [Ditylenchus destructor]